MVVVVAVAVDVDVVHTKRRFHISRSHLLTDLIRFKMAKTQIVLLFYNRNILVQADLNLVQYLYNIIETKTN